MISTELRRSAIYVGDGRVKQFSFPFKIFTSDQISVVALDASGADKIVEPSRYGVVLNPDQETEPGGIVEFSTAPESGLNFVVLSAVPYLQPLGLLNQGAFSAEDLNGAWDRNCILVQQLKEQLDRALLVPAAETKTPAQLINELLHAQTEAETYANAAANSAAEAATHANTVRNSVNEVKQVRDSAIAAIENAEAGAQSTIQTAGNEQVARVSAVVGDAETTIRQAGDVQCDRVAIAGKRVLARDVKLCGEGKDTVATALSEGSEFTLPEGVEYVVGFNHLRLSVNGLILYQGLQYTEVGTDFTLSTKVRMLMPLAVGDQVEAWVVPIGGSVDETTGVVTPEAGASCASQTWTVSSAVEAGSEVTLPNSMKYVVGRNHLRVSWNGLLLTPLYEFNEIGAEGSESATVTFTFPLSVGDEINAWTVPYERGNPSAIQGRIDALEEALAELSQKVVYKDAQSAS